MPDSADSNQYIKPFIYETLTSKALHFTFSEIQSRMQTLRPHALDLAYTRTMMGFLLFNPEPATLAMLGLGGGSIAKFCYRFLPTTHIKVIEINPHVIALRDEFQVPRDDERFKVRRGDGAEFVSSAPYRLDVLLVDGFDNEGQPPALCSQRFYDDCYDALKPDGLMVVNLHTGHRNFNSQVARIERTFGSELVLVGDEECSNTIVFAYKGLLSGRLKPSIPRKPKGFDRETWDELEPAFFSVASALKRATKADLLSGQSSVRFKS